MAVIIHRGTRIETIFAIVDDDGNVVQEVPITAQCQKLEMDVIGQAVAQLQLHRKRLEVEEAAAKAKAKSEKEKESCGETQHGET